MFFRVLGEGIDTQSFVGMVERTGKAGGMVAVVVFTENCPSEIPLLFCTNYKIQLINNKFIIMMTTATKCVLMMVLWTLIGNLGGGYSSLIQNPSPEVFLCESIQQILSPNSSQNGDQTLSTSDLEALLKKINGAELNQLFPSAQLTFLVNMEKKVEEYKLNNIEQLMEVDLFFLSGVMDRNDGRVWGLLQFFGECYRIDKLLSVQKMKHFLMSFFCQSANFEVLSSENKPQHDNLKLGRVLQTTATSYNPFDFSHILRMVQAQNQQLAPSTNTRSNSSNSNSGNQRSTTSPPPTTTTSTQIRNSSTSTQQNISSSTSTTIRSSSSTSSSSTSSSIQQVASSSYSSSQSSSRETTTNRQFPNIIFYHDVPLQFLKGEIFKFRGRVINAPTLINSLTMVFRKNRNGEKITCTHMFNTGSTEFQFDCEIDGDVIRQNGEEFFMSVYTGQFGGSSNQTRRIYTRGQPARVAAPARSRNARMVFQDNMLSVAWSSQQPLTKIQISQPSLGQGASFTFMLSNYHERLEFDPRMFGGFQANQRTVVKIFEAKSSTNSYYGKTSNFSSPVQLSFIAVQRQFDDGGDSALAINQIPWIVAPGSRISIRGTTKQQLRNDIYVQTPDKEFDKYEMLPGRQSVPPNSRISATLTFSQVGNHILEINHYDGYALLNRPVYVYGPGYYPLIPDFTLRVPRITNPMAVAMTQPRNLPQQRQLVLDLINEERRSAGEEPVVLDDTLSQVAQMHAQDMVNFDYSAHVNLRGQTPQDRATKMGIKTVVGQNIASYPNITQLNLRLARSPLHYENMLRDFWTRVGVGVAQMPYGSYKVVQLFSSRNFNNKPLQKDQIQEIQEELGAGIMRNNPQLIGENKMLTNALKQWHDNTSGPSILAFLRSKGFQRPALRNVIVPFTPVSLQKIEERMMFKAGPTQQYYGTTVKIVNRDMMEIFVAFV